MIPTPAEILAQLVAFPTLSRQSNLDLLDYVEGLLRPAGLRCERFVGADGQQANLWASLGPGGPGGVILSGHSDVVPVEGQDWSRDPFALHAEDGRYFGRGTADMKGFLAVAIHTALRAAGTPLSLPLHIAISYDEEIGCVGVRGMLDRLAERPDRPALCIVGEPTGMRIATGHKGKRALRASCHGQEAHSALAPTALNALHLGAGFVTALVARQRLLEERGARDPAYEVPYTTVHAGVMRGGVALNIVPNLCTLDFEIRNVAGDDPDAIIAGLRADANGIADAHRAQYAGARIELAELSGYPGLETPADLPAVRWLRALLGGEPVTKVSFGTEGGLFDARLRLPTIVCGPGHMAQGHKPDEYVSADQLAQCGDFLDAIVEGLRTGAAPFLHG